MEIRAANLIVGAPGGTAAKNSNTYKLSVPSAWIKEMGLSKDNHKLLISFDGSRIVISKKLTFQEFWDEAVAQKHHLLHISLMDGDKLCGEILADEVAQNVCVRNHTTDFLKMPFGNNQMPTWEDYQDFLENRCIPKSRAGLQEYLETLGVDSYDPMTIICKTQGRMAEDSLWLKVERIV